MDLSILPIVPVVVLIVCAFGLAAGLLVFSRVVNPIRPGPVKQMPYESGMDPIHDSRRRFDVRFFLLAIAFLVFDVEILFLYPWATMPRTHLEQAPVSLTSAAGEESRPYMADGDEELPAPARPQLSTPSCSRHVIFAGAMTFFALLVVGYVYDWRKEVFRWR